MKCSPKQRAKIYKSLAKKNLDWLFRFYVLPIKNKKDFPEAILFEPEKGNGYSKDELVLVFLFCEQIAKEAMK